MPFDFTEFITTLEPGRDPDSRRFQAAWQKLRDALICELRRRGLWGAAPSYLGVCGWRHWSQGNALDELVAECYVYIFLDRLQGLKAQLEIRENVEGLVYRNVQNFLYDTQKRNDPLGFKSFTALRRAARRLTRYGGIHVIAGDAKVANDTVLGFQPGPVSPDPERAFGLEEHVREWCDDLLPDLITARGRVADSVVARLAGRIHRLPELGIRSFYFDELAGPLKREVRARWSAMSLESEIGRGFEPGGGDGPRVVQAVEPDREVEERDAFDKLTAHVSAELAVESASPLTRAYLKKLWGYLKVHAREGREDRPLSRRKLARRLGIPRGRLAGLFASLGRRVEAGRSSLAKSRGW